MLAVASAKASDFAVHSNFPKTAEQIAANKLRDIIIPEIAFTNAPLSEVIQVLTDKSEEFDDPKISDGDQRGVNFTIEDEATRNKLVTLDMRFVTVHDLLKFALLQVNTRYHIAGPVIVITDQDGPLITRSYNVSPSDISELRKFKGDAGKLLLVSGAKSPPGASSLFVPSAGEIVLTNTRENLALFEQFLEDTNYGHSQIEIGCRLVLVDSASALSQIPLSVSVTNLPSLFSNAKTIMSSTICSTSGDPVTNRFCSPPPKSGDAVSTAEFQTTPMLWHYENSVTLPFSVSMNIASGKGGYFTYSLSSAVVINNGYARVFWISPPAGSSLEGSMVAMVLSVRRVDDQGMAIEFEPDDNGTYTRESNK